jgi:hypothetical protein
MAGGGSWPTAEIHSFLFTGGLLADTRLWEQTHMTQGSGDKDLQAGDWPGDGAPRRRDGPSSK